MRKHSRGHIINERLKHEARMLRLARIYGIEEPWLTKWLQRATDRKPCSCYMCGNERRYYGTKPIQERREDLRSAEIE